MSRILAIILAAVVIAAGTFYFYSSRVDQTETGTLADSRLGDSEESDASDSAALEDIPYDVQWREYLIGVWEWRDDGKELLFVFGADQRFLYYEAEHADNPNASDDNAFGRWEVIEADNFFSEVKLISMNEAQTEIIFKLEFIDNAQMAARTDDMPDDVYVLFTRAEE